MFAEGKLASNSDMISFKGCPMFAEGKLEA
jgi:hypothetical protein